MLTKVYGLHSNSRSVLAIALVVEEYVGRGPLLPRGVEGGEVTCVRAQLLNGSGTERVTGSNQDPIPILK